MCGRQGWANFTRDAQIAGIIDADYKTPRELERLREIGVFMLPLHEAESILCLPSAVEELSRAMHPAHAQVSASEVTGALVSRLVAQRIPIALRRAVEGFRTQFAPSIPATQMGGIQDDAQALSAFEQASISNLTFLQNQDARSTLQAELDRIDSAISNKDPTALLQLLPGKDLARQVCGMLRIKGQASELLTYYEKHFPKAELPYFQEIGKSLVNLFRTTTEQPTPTASAGAG